MAPVGRPEQGEEVARLHGLALWDLLGSDWQPSSELEKPLVQFFPFLAGGEGSYILSPLRQAKGQWHCCRHRRRPQRGADGVARTQPCRLNALWGVCDQPCEPRVHRGNHFVLRSLALTVLTALLHCCEFHEA